MADFLGSSELHAALALVTSVTTQCFGSHGFVSNSAWLTTGPERNTRPTNATNNPATEGTSPGVEGDGGGSRF